MTAVCENDGDVFEKLERKDDDATPSPKKFTSPKPKKKSKPSRKVEEQPKVPKKRKLMIYDSEGEPKKGKACQYIQNMSDNYKGKYLIDIDPSDGIQKFKCDECGMFFKSNVGILYHKRNFHSNNQDQELQKCCLCDEVFPSNLMANHMGRKHVKKTNGVYKCILCSEVFRLRPQLLCHFTKEHKMGEFRQKCDECDKLFDTKHNLSRHKKVQHTNSFSGLICDKCGKEFKIKDHLESHMKSVHHIYNITKEETIKKCDKCDIDFEVPEEFNDHLKQCLDKPKNFKCKFCDTCWVSHLSLGQHIVVDHKMIQFVCEVCLIILHLNFEKRSISIGNKENGLRNIL